jgi:UPF0716 family protein affecting phage T7 exclusion
VLGPNVTCSVPDVTCFVPGVICFVPGVICFVPGVICFVPDVICFVPDVFCWWSVAPVQDQHCYQRLSDPVETNYIRYGTNYIR